MKTFNRQYSDIGGDFELVCDFLIHANLHQQGESTWSLCRFVDWRYGLYKSKTTIADFWDRNAQLWFDGFGKLAGLAVSEDGGTGVGIITASGYRLLFPEILDWVLHQWHNRGALTLEITEKQTFEAQILARAGFKIESEFFKRYFDLTRELPPTAELPDGFTIIDMATHPEYRAQRILRANAFEGIEDISEDELNYRLEFYNYTNRAPTYHAPVDLCVKASDGRHVASCEGLIDAWNSVAELERICTHTQFRQRGFARAAIIECLHRLKDIGIRKAFITGYSPQAIALYGSLGAVDELQCFVYTMAMPNA